jgi:hypothetical protein
MGKKKANGAAASKPAALTAEEFQKLSPEEQVAHLNSLQESNSALQAEADTLKKEATKDLLPSFEVEDDDANDVEGGEYQFTCPTFTWDDNSVINVRELVAEASGKDKAAEKAQGIMAALVARKSGIVLKKEG